MFKYSLSKIQIHGNRIDTYLTMTYGGDLVTIRIEVLLFHGLRLGPSDYYTLNCHELLLTWRLREVSHHMTFGLAGP